MKKICKYQWLGMDPKKNKRKCVGFGNFAKWPAAQSGIIKQICTETSMLNILSFQFQHMDAMTKEEQKTCTKLTHDWTVMNYEYKGSCPTSWNSDQRWQKIQASAQHIYVDFIFIQSDLFAIKKRFIFIQLLVLLFLFLFGVFLGFGGFFWYLHFLM